MFCKVLCLSLVVCLVSGQQGGSSGSGGSGGHGHEHHGYSSQFVHRHDEHPHEIKIEVADKHGHKHHIVDYYAAPKYEFGYKVKDEHTHDIKSQHETRHGDEVKGYYELVEKDGSLRKVEYHSDKKTGFQAQVKHETHHIIPEHHHHH